MTTNTDIIAAALREYGDAFRYSWGNVDARAIKLDMYSFADAVEGVSSAAEYTIEEWRNYLDICPRGGGHWSYWCTRECSDG